MSAARGCGVVVGARVSDLFTRTSVCGTRHEVRHVPLRSPPLLLLPRAAAAHPHGQGRSHTRICEAISHRR